MEAMEIRTILAVEREAVLSRLRSMISEFDEIVVASADSNGDDEHDPEGSTVAFERARLAALIGGARASIEDLDRASARIDDGTYGRCGRCGGPIDPDRLAALPAVETCVACVGGPRSHNGTSERSLIQGVTTTSWRIPPPKTLCVKDPPLKTPFLRRPSLAQVPSR